ncbi:hypothetical protein MPTK1_4g07470 [Marchantia polymorpha subsp. ruderalis]|uniref:Uncharacterized protein n=2 Tax=Marchantia polymorpha TaxID=3197 RepID=A0AAF6B7F3_MARPO|nr:hypothetical protein MARPO_0115s0034 [Marchantia polymorpha]BBN07937.1 hypothetical protein Mp_4g07470 [Marchantia polymorpha subsp. ruderalis]|eukprot:PTQ31117.1 hypothetical protein MARPO_0115s0034 [Marchantia polymorpha]
MLAVDLKSEMVHEKRLPFGRSSHHSQYCNSSPILKTEDIQRCLPGSKQTHQTPDCTFRLLSVNQCNCILEASPVRESKGIQLFQLKVKIHSTTLNIKLSKAFESRVEGSIGFFDSVS